MGPETRISQEPPAHTLTDELHGTVHYEPSLTTDDGSSTNNQ